MRGKPRTLEATIFFEKEVRMWGRMERYATESAEMASYKKERDTCYSALIIDKSIATTLCNNSESPHRPINIIFQGCGVSKLEITSSPIRKYSKKCCDGSEHTEHLSTSSYRKSSHITSSFFRRRVISASSLYFLLFLLTIYVVYDGPQQASVHQMSGKQVVHADSCAEPAAARRTQYEGVKR